MIAVASAVEPLRMANRQSKHRLYEWTILTCDGYPVRASNGIATNPSGGMNDFKNLDIVFVCGGINIKTHSENKPLINWLKKLSNRKIPIGALCTGTYVLAKAGLLSDVRCTVHWEIIDAMREEFPDLILTQQIFEIDGARYTCAGGQAPLDMMLGIIHNSHGRDLASQISEEFMCERIRDRYDKQKIPLRYQLGTSCPNLLSIVALMDSNVEEPLSLSDLASHVKLSRRQIQRLFQQYLGVSPTRYYLTLRLNNARQLLHFTNKSIVDIGLACGFVSAPHFSKRYRDEFGISPTEERTRGRELISTEQNMHDLFGLPGEEASNFRG